MSAAVFRKSFLRANERAYRALSSSEVALGIGVAAAFAFLVATIFLLGHRSLWLDEFFSAAFAAADQPFARAMADSIATDSQPPLYYSLLHVWIGWFGDGALAMRSANLLGFVMLGAAMVYSWRMPVSRAVWAVFWLLLFSSRFTWDFATEARSYFLTLSTASLLTVVTYNIATRIAAHKGVDALSIALLTAGGLIAGGLHYFGFILAGSLIAVLFAYALIEKQNKTALILFGAGGLALAAEGAWMAYSLPRLWFDANHFWLRFDPLFDARVFTTSVFSSNLVIVALFALALVYRRRTILKNRPVVVLGAAFVLGCLVSLAISIKQPMFYHRYLSVYTPVVLFVASYALLRGMPRITTLATLAAALLISLPIAVSRSLPHRQDWEGAVTYIEDNYGAKCDTARFMTVHHRARDIILRYLARGRNWASVPFNQAGFDQAAHLSCPVVAWASTVSLEDAQERLASVDLRGRDVEIVPFEGVFLVVANDP